MSASIDETLPGLPPEEDAPELVAGKRIGPYELVREIGRGGMGSVFLALRADDEYRKQVAIKLVKRGMDSELVLRRFREERQILANLVHPSIAALLDGGTTEDGRPYLVMEHVAGEPIDRFCGGRTLGLVARLDLFRKVCAAVHHAHQSLVIHCDLKPRNILVTGEGEPKLLDFGIAKLLRPDLEASRTMTSLRQMTPEYASPEQVRGEILGTATDVYSLGVVLYELLTGLRPYRFSTFGPDELERLICREDPPRPSAVLAGEGGAPTVRLSDLPAASNGRHARKRRRELEGDLDNVVMKAMHKEPARRYASAEQLGEDLRRHLAGLPVLARPDTVAYRAAKFVRRNRAGVAAAVVLFASLVGGVVTTSYQARVAETERGKAQIRFGEVRQLAHSFLFEFHDAIQDLAGATPARELLVRRGLEYLDRLAREAGDDPGLQAELAAAYRKVGDVQGRPGFANLGDRNGALASYRKARELRKALADRGALDDAGQRELALDHDRIGDVLLAGGNSALARRSYEDAVGIREGLAPRAPGDPGLEADLARGYQRIADALAAAGDARGAIDIQGKALAIQIARGERADASAASKRDLFIGYLKTGNRELEGRSPSAALSHYRKAQELAHGLAKEDPANARAQRERAVADDKVGDALRALGDRQAASVQYQAALAVRERLSGADPKNAELRRDRAVSHSKLGTLKTEGGDLGGALDSLRRALALDEAALRADAANDQAHLDVASDLQAIGDVLRKAGATEEASSSYARAHETWAAATARDPENAEVRLDLARVETALARAESALALATEKSAAARRLHCAAARSWLERARRSWQESGNSGRDPGDGMADLAPVQADIARCAAATGLR